MIKAIKSAISSGHGTALLYTASLSFIFADLVPTPADAWYFNFQQKNKAKLQEGIITPRQYWVRDAESYYFGNIVWWSLVLGAMVLTKGDYSKKAKIGLGIVAGGMVLGVLSKNIKKDEELMKKLSK